MAPIKPALYISQNWRKSPYEENFAERASWEYLADSWSDRSCGLACVSMILLRRLGIYVDYCSLLQLGLELGAYCSRGWIHTGLAQLLSKFGIAASAMPLHRDEVEAKLEDGHLLITSVSHKLPIDGSKGGHLILLHGTRFHDLARYIMFSDPSRWGEAHRCVTSNRLFASYSGRVIVCPPAGEIK